MVISTRRRQIAELMGARVQERRQASNLTLDAVAKAIGKSVDDLAAAETGEALLSPEDILGLCPILRVQPSWFFEGLF